MNSERRTQVMGIINTTPDSFYPGSRRPNLSAALETARAMVGAGVDIIDVGGESSRPGSDPVSEQEELDRVIPLISAIRGNSDIKISVDTTKEAVAAAAIDAGAGIINDISGLRLDPAMPALVARRDVSVVIMHMRGTPRTMQKAPCYHKTLGEVSSELSECVEIALQAGIARERIILDPGIGFGKRLEDNLRILRDLSTIKAMGFSVLIGLSRKSFIGAVLDRDVDERFAGTVAANAAAILNGADIIRVHDYQAGVDTARMIDAIRYVGEEAPC